MEKGTGIVKEITRLFAAAYFVIIFGIYPFYMKNGYVEIGEGKYRFFIYVSIAALVILGILGIFCALQCMFRGRKEKKEHKSAGNVSLEDILLVLFMVVIVFSTIFSVDEKQAFRGAEGWRMGAVFWLVLGGLYLLLSRIWKAGKWMYCFAALSAGAVFFLGICDRFSFHLIPLEIRDPAFLSTLGNINWYCGYYSVLAPVCVSLFFFAKSKKECILWGAVAFLYFMAGFCQGASSVFLIFGALLYLLLFVSLQNKKWLARWCELVSLWAFASQGIGLLRRIRPEGYLYETDNLCGLCTETGVLFGVGAAFLIAAFLFHKAGEGELKSRKKLQIFLGLLPVAVLLIIGVFVTAGSGNAAWSASFGNGRGMIWKISGKMLGYRNLWQKLFGVGPDCFGVFAYSLPEIAGELRNFFGNDRLTNAHNELLTQLVNTGLLGTVFYFGFLGSSFVNCMKKGRENTDAYITALCIFCYVIHNMVSFTQVLNVPFLFLLMALGRTGAGKKGERAVTGLTNQKEFPKIKP